VRGGDGLAEVAVTKTDRPGFRLGGLLFAGLVFRRGEARNPDESQHESPPVDKVRSAESAKVGSNDDQAPTDGKV
jgi:hypothetical protein